MIKFSGEMKIHLLTFKSIFTRLVAAGFASVQRQSGVVGVTFFPSVISCRSDLHKMPSFLNSFHLILVIRYWDL